MRLFFYFRLRFFTFFGDKRLEGLNRDIWANMTDLHLFIWSAVLGARLLDYRQDFFHLRLSLGIRELPKIDSWGTFAVRGIKFGRGRRTERRWREITGIVSGLAPFLEVSLVPISENGHRKRIWSSLLGCGRGQITEREWNVLVLDVVLAEDLTRACRWSLIDHLISIFFDVQV